MVPDIQRNYRKGNWIQNINNNKVSLLLSLNGAKIHVNFLSYIKEIRAAPDILSPTLNVIEVATVACKCILFLLL